MRNRFFVTLVVSLVSCAPAAEVGPSRSTSSRAASPSAVVEQAPAPSPPAKPRPDAAGIFELLKPRLVRCYEDGKRSVPTMLDGKLTLNAAIDSVGKTTCVIPTDDTGLTQEVEDCMSARFAELTFERGAASTASLPIAVRAGAVQLGEQSAGGPMMASVETHRMPDAFDVLESIEPELYACVRDMGRGTGPRSIIVGARVGADGRAQCALASASPEVVPPKVADCSEAVLRRAKFPPPKGGSGLILVPIARVR